MPAPRPSRANAADKIMGNAIRDEARRRGIMRPFDMEVVSGVRAGTVGRYYRGESPIPLPALFAMAEGMGMTPDELVAVVAAAVADEAASPVHQGDPDAEARREAYKVAQQRRKRDQRGTTSRQLGETPFAG